MNTYDIKGLHIDKSLRVHSQRSENGATLLRGIDINQYQSEIALLGSDCDFVIVKATQGDWEDVTFNGSGTYDGRRRFLFRDARWTGLIVGAYHYLTHGITGDEQAITFVRALKRANDAHCDGALCVLFVEHDVKHQSVPTKRDVQDFIETFKRLVPNQPLIIATNAWYWSSKIMLDLQQYDDVYVMLERWTDASGQIATVNPMVPDEWWDITIGGRKPILIQFTSQARVEDVRVDGILYRGDRASLARLAEVTLPFVRTAAKPSMPSRLIMRQYEPVQASTGDIRKRAGKTTLVTIGSLIGVAAIVGAFAFIAMRAGDKTEAIFE